jgi:hypothetical protein
MIRRTFLAIVAVLALAATANAGTVYVWLVIDPLTTAGAGVPVIPSNGSNLAVSSSRSGPGSWHLFALDDADSSAGIRSFSIKLNGNVSSVLNRSPTTSWNDADDVARNAGLNDLRTTTPTIGAGQGVTNPVAIGGFGQTASNFGAKLPAATSFAVTTSGQWGTYAAADGITSGNLLGHQRSAVFLAEGLYTGAAPTVDTTTPIGSFGTAVNIWNATGFPNLGSSTVSAGGFTNTLSNFSPFFGLMVYDDLINNVNASSPGSLAYSFLAFETSGPVTWSDFAFVSYSPDAGAVGTGPAIPATYDPSGNKFNWTTIGSPIGTYIWKVRATSGVSTDVGFLRVHITQVPEPATLSLFALAIIAGVGRIHRRKI